MAENSSDGFIDERIPDDVYIDLGIAGVNWRSIITCRAWYMLVTPEGASMSEFFDAMDSINASGYKVFAGTYDAAGLLGGHQIEFVERSKAHD